MEKRLYVGNLPFRASDEEIKETFSEFGEVVDVYLVNDRETGRPKGFGFVEMESTECAQKAIDALDGQDFGGRTIRVNMAQKRN